MKKKKKSVKQNCNTKPKGKKLKNDKMSISKFYKKRFNYTNSINQR